jgi:basic amino acid/polyamine antiporter, APA family
MSLKRRLSLFDATLLVVGNVVGAGIFTTAGFLAGQLPAPALFIGIWVVGGLLTLCGALTYAEMSSMFPRSGGDYLFLKAAYGPWAGFLLGWICFWVINPGSIAVLSIALVKYLQVFFPFSGFLREKLAALVVILFLSFLNYRGVRMSGTAQDLCTLGSMVIIVFLIIGGLILGKGAWQHFNTPHSVQVSLSSLFGPAMIAVIFSYSGWFVSAYVGDEVKRPEHNLPLSLALGTMVVAVLYTLLNVVYVYALPITELKGVINVGLVVGEKLFSPFVAKAVCSAIILAVGASINATVLSGARITYAMAQDGLIWAPLKRLHRKHGTPHTALLVQTGLACLFVIVETFDKLLSYVVFIMLLSSIGSGVAHLILRWRKPLLERPYRTWGYPFIPVLFVSLYVWIAGQIALADPGTSLVGVGITLSGIPFYLRIARKRGILESVL